MNSIFLIQSSIYLFVFILVYRLLIANLTHFSWMRVYLLLSLLLSVVLPFIEINSIAISGLIGFNSSENSVQNILLNIPETVSAQKLFEMNNSYTAGASGISLSQIAVLVYFIGILVKILLFGKNLFQIRQYVKRNKKERVGSFWYVDIKEERPAFSFLNYIFINKEFKNLNSIEIQSVIDHEIIHAKYFHTIDLLFIELFSVVFWFNPFIRLTRRYLKEVHEFIVDRQLTLDGVNKKNYSELLLNLATMKNQNRMSTAFSGKEISRRIKMINQERSTLPHKLVFFIMLPLSAFLLISFSVSHDLGKVKNSKSNMLQIDLPDNLKVGNIYWEGNTLIKKEILNKVFSLKTGDDYHKGDFSKAIHSEDGISTLYMDLGYVFFNAVVEEKVREDAVVDLYIEIYEGLRAKIGDIIIKGNKRVSDSDILEFIYIYKGDWFNRTAIVESVQALEAIGKFEPGKVVPTPIPDPGSYNLGYAIVDLEFKVSEKN